jgi:hypothetical protein
MAEDPGQQGDWITLRAAAEAAGISEKSARRRIKDGYWRARRVDSPYGPAWQVWMASDGSAPTTLDNGNGESPYPVTETLDSALTSLVALVREQQTTIMELSGRLGFLQAELQQRDAVILALQAPQEEPTPGEEPPATVAAAEERPRASWWRRVLLGE